MNSQTIRTSIYSSSPSDLFNGQYLSNVIFTLIEVYERAIRDGHFNMVCNTEYDETINIFAIRPETPEEEARRLQQQAKVEKEERELLAELQAKYSELVK